MKTTKLTAQGYLLMLCLLSLPLCLLLLSFFPSVHFSPSESVLPLVPVVWGCLSHFGEFGFDDFNMYSDLHPVWKLQVDVTRFPP